MDIREALEAANIEVRNGSNDDEILICCPFCLEEGELTQDTRFRLGINIVSGKAQCFNCQKKSGGGEYIFEELQRVLETGEIEANEESRKATKKHFSRELPEGFTLIKGLECKEYWNNTAWRYLRSRHISEKQIIEKNIGYTVVGKYNHRVIFPAYYKGKLRGFIGRDFTNKQELTYKNSVGDKTIYNIPDRHNKSIVLSEGVFDSLVIERGSLKMGIDSGSVLGHSLKDDQIKLLEPYKTIILWMDADDPGIDGLLKIAKKIPKDKIVRAVLPKDFDKDGVDCDPSELDHTVIAKKLDKAKIFTEARQEELRAWRAFQE